MSALPVRAAAAADLRVEIVEDYRDFLALEHAWNEVLAGAGIEHPFLTHEWLRTWWECFGGGGRLCIVAVRAGASIVALAPLMLTRVRVYGVPARRLGSISNVHTPRFDFLVADRGEEAYAAIWRTVQGLGRLWDLFELSQLPSGSRTLDAMSGLAAACMPAARSPITS